MVTGVPFVTDVLVSHSSMGVFGEDFLSAVLLSLESVEPFLWKLKEARVWRARWKECRQQREGRFRMWTVESTTGVPRFVKQLQKGCWIT